MWGIVTRLWARKSGSSSLSTEYFSLLQNIQTGSGANPASYPNQEFFVWLKSGCSIRNMTTRLHLELQWRISGVKPFLPVCAIIMSTRKLYLYLYWLCACKLKVYHTITCAMAKPRIRDHSMTQRIVIMWDR